MAEELLFRPLRMRNAVLEADASGGDQCAARTCGRARLEDAFWASGHDGRYVVVVPSADLVVVRTGFSPGSSPDAVGGARRVGEVVRAVGWPPIAAPDREIRYSRPGSVTATRVANPAGG